MLPPFDTPPDHVNEAGVKWWLDRDLTQHCTTADRKGVSLAAQVFFVEEPSGVRTRLLVCTETQRILAGSPTLEGIGLKIDLYKAFRQEAT